MISSRALRLFLLLLAVAVFSPSQPATAQGARRATSDHRLSAKLQNLIERWQKTNDAEEEIAALESALRLEPQIKQWTLKESRAMVKGRLLFGLGDSYQNRVRGERAENLEKAIAAYQVALTVRTREALPQDWAQTQSNLAIAYTQRIRGERAENLEKAIAACQAALTVRTREARPLEWAETQHNLGSAYAQRIRGERAENLEKAIAGFEAALAVRTREALPDDWAETQHNLAIVYAQRIRGERAENLEKTIGGFEAELTVLTREARPHEWADTQQALADAYTDRIRGDLADNLEKAIAGYEAALTVRTRDALPHEWAQAQDNLGRAYAQRIHGERAANLEKAIACFEAALTVRTREALPREWADTQQALASTYAQRIRGEHTENLDKAIAGFKAALTVRTREARPGEWAQTQYNLGNAYAQRIRSAPAGELESGERAVNQEEAIEAYEAALTVYTREARPREWAETQQSLASTYAQRILGWRDENLDKAIAAFEAALTVRTREARPLEWAVTQHNLANTYMIRSRGDRADNLEKAIAAYEAALTVFTREALPRDHLRTARLLGSTLLNKRNWSKARTVLVSARAAFLVLFGQGLDDAEARDLIDTARALFGEAAYATAQQGDLETALDLLMEGKARLMAVALKLQALDLPPEQRARLETLRAHIRDQTRAMEAAQGLARSEALEELTTLRRELLGLVERASSSQKLPGGALALARGLVPEGGAIAAAVVTNVGGKLLIIAAPHNGEALSSVDLPDLTTARLTEFMRGRADDFGLGGWLGAYNVNYIDGQAELERRWPEWIAAIGDLGPALWRQGGERLHAALKERGVKTGARLIWLPTGALGIVPVGLAQDPVSKRRFGDDYEIVYAPSLETLAAAQHLIAKATPPSLAAIINPTNDLPGTEKEGAIVASHFTSERRVLLERGAATPEAVLAALKGKTHWHFASHGTFSWEDARRSALVMHGRARLTVGRLLDTDGLGRPRLVVLSACETGLYDIDRNPDEFIGLPGAFTALGAVGVLGTLWPVSDDATALLIAKFYELHLGAGLAPPTALNRAQAWLREATNDDLTGYAKLALAQGRLQSRHLAEIEKTLSAEGLTRSRNSQLVEWITRDGKPGANTTDPSIPKPLARPYAHPYFWGGFIHTGL